VNQMSVFEPKIIAFLCNWCTYVGADLAGTSRIQYPPNVRVVRVMCSGAVDTLEEILKGVGMDEDRVWLRWIAASEVEILRRG
jgi:coenzyme F420-reducing hydrogenase delta subunit